MDEDRRKRFIALERHIKDKDSVLAMLLQEKKQQLQLCTQEKRRK